MARGAELDVVLDDEGLWSLAPLAGVAARRRPVHRGGVVRAVDVWPLQADEQLPARLADLLHVAVRTGGQPGPGLVAAARWAVAVQHAARGGLVPVPYSSTAVLTSRPGWRWSATPGPDEADAWQATRGYAPSLTDDLLAALTGPVAAFPDDVPWSTTGRRTTTWRAWADRVAARRAAGARLALRLDAPDPEGLAAQPDSPPTIPSWRLVPIAVDLATGTTRLPIAVADPAAFGASETAWARWRAAEAAALTTAWPEGPLDDALAPTALTAADVLALVDLWAGRVAAQGIDVLAASGLLRVATVRKRARSASRSGPAGLTAAEVALTLGVTVDDVELTEAEIAELAASKSELVLVRGRWTRVEADERAQLARLLRRLETPVAAADLLADEAFAGLDLDPPEQLTLARRVDPPTGLAATLRHYQRDGLDWLTWIEENGTGGVLADDMGLGKTVQVLARIVADHPGPTLVVCPLTLVDTWARQAAQFAPDLVVAAHHGAEREDLTALAARADIVVTTYGLLARDAALATVDWHRVVLDEAQAIKNPDTRTARAARGLTAKHRLAVTGTPVENHLGELWSIMAFAAPTILPRRKEFERRYVGAGVDDAALSRLRVVTAPFVLRRTKTDPGVAPDLPDRTVIREDCALTREQVGAYEAAAAAMLEEVAADPETGRSARRLHVLSGIARLKQILVHPAMLTEGSGRATRSLAGGSGKVDRLVELLAQITDEGQAAVVFTQFASFVPVLAEHLRSELAVQVLTLTGADDRSHRAATVEAFSADDGPPVLIASLKAGGTGLTLVRANHVVHLDRWWNPAVEDQASDRVWRIGQKQKVFVHTLVCPGTLEDRIDALLSGKRAVASAVVRSTETRVSELTDDELSDLVTLVRERVIS